MARGYMGEILWADLSKGEAAATFSVTPVLFLASTKGFQLGTLILQPFLRQRECCGY